MVSEVLMKKILYVDLPFEGIAGGDKNRSSFIWKSLASQYDADLLLIRSSRDKEISLAGHHGYDQLFTLESSEPWPFQSQSIYRFALAQKKEFSALLKRKRYEIVVFRFLSTFTLARIARKVLPDCRIAIDVDMLFSRIATLSWLKDRSIKNRFYFLESLKLKAFEAYAFRRKMHFFFTNSSECDYALRVYHADHDKCHIFPNMMPDKSKEYHAGAFAKKFILFFGTLDSSANQDAYEYLCSQIYPRISKKLQEKDLYIYVVGKNPTQLYDKLAGGRIKIIGEVEDVNEYIAGSIFVILPLRIASGTRTRILEAALHKKAVITTTLGAEGLEIGQSEVVIKDDAEGFSKAIGDLIQNPGDIERLGVALYNKCSSLYSQEAVSKNFIAALEDTRTEQVADKKRRRLAIITNRFYPEVGGAETNIYYQARELARHYDVSVICPKRIAKPKVEATEGFRVIRLWDVYNTPAKYPNLEARTLCPGLILHLLKEGYDLIQCFPAVNYNNILAFLVAKFTGTPYVMCFFDFIDYAALIKSEGKINPNILDQYTPSFIQKIILKGMDSAFAIAEKEMDYIRRYNPCIEYSPVPILVSEYEQKIASPRSKYHLKDEHFIFLCLGRISSIKGQDIALEAFSKALPQMKGAKLVFVGRTDYEPQFYEYLESYVSQNLLGDCVLFTGMVEREEVIGWLRFADIHVIPVRFMNSGAVVVESWISGTPVIQSDVVDPNLVIEDYNGYLFKSENSSELAAKMFLAYHSKNRLNKLAENGKALVKSKYTYEYLIELYDKTYERLLNRK